MKSTKAVRVSLVLAMSTFLAVDAASAPAESQGQSPTGWEERALLRDYALQPLFVPTAPGEPLDVGVTVGGEARVLSLRPRSVRATDFRVIVANGPDMREVPPPLPRTYVGFVRDFPGSVVAASIVDGQLWARVEYAGSDIIWQIQPLSSLEVGVDPTLHVTYSNLDLLPSNFTCGAPDAAPPLQPDPAPPGHGVGSGCFSITEIAIDADVEYWQQNGSSVPATVADIENLMNTVDVIYSRDVAIVHSITTIIVRTGDPTSDPYDNLKMCGSLPNMLSEFQDWWNNNHAGIERDVAHLMTGRSPSDGFIGCAYLSVVCSQTSGYGVSRARWTGNILGRTGIVAHELGHNWSAPHCDGDPNGCWTMCAFIGGCDGHGQLGPASVSLIEAFRDTRNCLDDSGTYVDMAATAPYYGTQEHPFLTVAEGVNCAGVPGPSDVFIQAGLYVESPLVIDKNVILRAVGGNVGIR